MHKMQGLKIGRECTTILNQTVYMKKNAVINILFYTSTVCFCCTLVKFVYYSNKGFCELYISLSFYRWGGIDYFPLSPRNLLLGIIVIS